MDYIPPPVIEDQLEDVMDTRSDSKSIVEENDESNVLASLVPSLKSSDIQNDGMKEDESNVESTMDLDVKEHHDSTVFEDVVMKDKDVSNKEEYVIASPIYSDYLDEDSDDGYVIEEVDDNSEDNENDFVIYYCSSYPKGNDSLIIESNNLGNDSTLEDESKELNIEELQPEHIGDSEKEELKCEDIEKSSSDEIEDVEIEDRANSISEDIEDVSSEEDLQDKQEEITGMNDETNSDDEDNEDKSSEEDVKVEEKQKEIEESSSEEIEDVDKSNNVDKDIVDTSSSEEEEDEVDYPKVTVEEDGSNLSEEENEDPESNHTEEEEEEDRMRDATILQMLSQREDIFTDDKIEEEEGEMEEYEEEDEDNKRVEIDLSDESSTNSDDSNDESSRNIRKVANRSHFGSRHPARYTKDNVSSSSDENLSGSEELEESSIGSESDEGESSRRSFLKKRRYSEFASSDSDEQVYSGSSLRLAPNPKKMKLEWSDSDSSIYSSSPEEPVDDDPVIILDSSDEDEPIAEVSSENEEDNESETTEGKELVSISEMEKEESKDEPISEEYLLRQKYLEDREAIKQFWIEEIKRIGLFLLQELEQFSIDDANVLRNSMESFEEIEHYTNNILERNIRLILYLLVRLIRIRLHNPTAFVPAAKRKLIVSIQSYQDEIYILQRILQREQIPNENTFKQIAHQELLNSQELLEKYRENNRGPQAFAIHPLSLGDLVKK